MSETLNGLSRDLRKRLADLSGRAHRLSPLDIHARMDAIRDLAGRDGLSGLEELARCSAQLALLPGCRVATAECLSHVCARGQFSTAAASGSGSGSRPAALIRQRNGRSVH